MTGWSRLWTIDERFLLGRQVSFGPKGDGGVRAGKLFPPLLEYYQAIHQALTGDAVFARLKLLRMQGENPDEVRVKNALEAFGKCLGLHKILS